MYYHFKIPYLPILDYDLKANIVNLLSEKVNKSYQILIIDLMEQTNSKIMTVGMVEPENKKTIKMLEKKFNCIVMPFAIDIEEWFEVITNFYIGDHNDNLQENRETNMSIC